MPQTAAPLDEGDSSGTLRVLAHDVAQKSEKKNRPTGSSQRKKVGKAKSSESTDEASQAAKSKEGKAPRKARKKKASGQTETELDIELPKIARTESTIIIEDVSRKKTITIVVLNVILVALVGYYFTMV